MGHNPVFQDYLRYKEIVSFSVPYTIDKKQEFPQPVSIEESSTFLASSSNYYSGFHIAKKNKERTSVQSRTPHNSDTNSVSSPREVYYFSSLA